MSNLEGMVLSDYLLLQCISKGGVADVYRAYQQGESNREAAVKAFRPSYADRASFRDYFMLEAEKIGQFDHPNILPLLEYGAGEQLLYVITPFVTTGTLDDLLTRMGGRLSALQALPIMQQLCSAAQYAHDHNVMHGNIKPGNIFVAADGRMLLADFGIARGYDDSQQSLTRVGWGSAEYASPEQSLGILHPSSDIYALGVLLFRLLTGIPPFSGQTPIEVLLKHVRQSPPSARELMHTISEKVENVLRIALQKRSDERFATAEALSNALLAAVMIAPVASPVSRHLGVPAPLFASPSLVTNPTLNDPLTPLPPFIALSPLLNPAPISETASAFFPEDGSLLQKPVAFPAEEMTGSDVTEIRRKNFLQEDDEKDLGQFWLADPQEWSPLADPLSADRRNDAPPLTAGEYLRSKPLIADLPPVSPPATDTFPEQKKTHKGIHKWLPVVIVILLLLGLLGALLSSLLFPAEKPGTAPEHIPATITAQYSTIGKSSRSHAKVAPLPSVAASMPTATAIATHPTTKPGAPTPPTNLPGPLVACTGGSITLDGSANFQPAIQRLTSDYATQCASSTPDFSINVDGSKAGLDAVANGSSTLAYSDLTSTGRTGLVDHPLAALTYVVIVSNDVGVKNLQTAQLQGIYTGSITNWSQVGGANEAITIMNRPSDSAIRALFEAYILHGVAQSAGGTSLWFQSDSSDTIAQAVLSRQGAISYIPLFSALANTVPTVAINGVQPAIATVESGAYPFWGVEHLYSNGPASGLAQGFLTLSSTASGQSDLANYNAVPIKHISASVLSAHGSGPGI